MTSLRQKVLELGNSPLNWGELEQPARHRPGREPLRRLGAHDDAPRCDGCIAEARFLAHGCLSALAASSVLTEMARGKTPPKPRRSPATKSSRISADCRSTRRTARSSAIAPFCRRLRSSASVSRRPTPPERCRGR